MTVLDLFLLALFPLVGWLLGLVCRETEQNVPSVDRHRQWSLRH